jgi:SAM-dependent methyltransferase
VSLRRRWLDQDLEALAGRLEGRGLEIGSGREYRRGRFRPQPAANWVTLDLRARPRPHVIGDAGHLPLAACAFDAVVCSEVGEYLPRPAQALAEIAHVLKPGGCLLWATPFLHRADAADDLWRFTEAGLRRLLAEAGLHVIEVRAQGAALGVAANVLRYAVMAIPQRAPRLLLGGLAYLPLRLLAAADRPAARLVPALTSFTTGFVVLASKPS